MNKRTVEVSLHMARQWYNEGSEELRCLALQAFTEEELTKDFFQNIKTIDDAVSYLKNNHMCESLLEEYRNTIIGSYSETICECRIVVAALTNDEELDLINGVYYTPHIQLCEIGKEENCIAKKKVGTIECNGKMYNIMGSCAIKHTSSGVSMFIKPDGMTCSFNYMNNLLVSSKEIAQYISEQFGRLVFLVNYGGINCDWKWAD